MAEKIRLGYGALSSDTELLTPTGWLNISKVTEETLVAQYSIDGHISFTRPNYIRLEKPEKAIHIYNKEGHFDQLVGIDHAAPYIYTPTGEFKVMPANRVTRNCTRKYLHTGILLGGSITALSPVDRLRIAFQADGSIKRCGITSDYIAFQFAKDRKIERLHGLLKAVNVDYKTRLRKNGQTEFKFSAPPGFYEKDFSWLDLTHLSQSWCLEFIEELSHWDSTIRESEHFRCEYWNNRKLAVDRAQAVATLAGYKTCLGIVPHEDDPSRQISYRLSIFGGSKSTTGNHLITETVDYDDLMYGVRVDSNMLVMRRNDAVSITGCGNMLLLKDPVINTDCGHLV